MKYRETIIRKLESIEGSLRKMDFMLKRGGSSNEFSSEVENISNLTKEVKSYIEREDLSGHEINKR